MLKKPQAIERAKVLSAAAAKAGPLFVMASASESPVYDKSLAMAQHTCKCCTANFCTNATLAQPFCVNCGSDEVADVTTASDLSLPSDDAELCFATCEECGNTHNMLNVAHAAVFKGTMHCAACGAGLSFHMAADGQEPMFFDAEQQDGDDDFDGDNLDVDGDDTDSVDDVTADLGDPDPDPDGVADGDQQIDDVPAQDVEDELADMGQVSAPDSLPVNDGAVDTHSMDDPTVAASVMAINAVASVSSKSPVTLVRQGQTLHAFAKNVHVASINSADLPAELAGIEDSVVEQVLNHTIKGSNLQSALAQVKFTLAKVLVKRDAVVKAAVTAGLSEETAKLAKATETAKAAFQQSLSLAAVALNKGFYTEHPNVLKSELAAALAGAGVQAPNRLIDQVFARVGEQYNKSLLTMAADLTTKSDETRNELARTLGQAAYQATAAEDGDEDGSDQSEETASVLPFTPALANTTASRSEVVATTKVTSVRGTFGRM